MNRFALLLLTLPLGACATDGLDIPSYPSVAQAPSGRVSSNKAKRFMSWVS